MYTDEDFKKQLRKIERHNEEAENLREQNEEDFCEIRYERIIQWENSAEIEEQKLKVMRLQNKIEKQNQKIFELENLLYKLYESAKNGYEESVKITEK